MDWKSKTLGVAIAGSIFVYAATGKAVSTESSDAQPPARRPHLDIAFCIDTTGSMQNEIDNVKTKVKQLVAKLAGGKPAPIVRVGLVAYRDRGDDYVTKTFPFSDNIDNVVKDISALEADGGGDTPEALNQGLHAALHDLKWDEDKKTAKLLFLIGDAGPHEYAGDFNWQTESKQAISRGIQINTIACEGLQNTPAPQGIDIFQKIAKLTDGAFESLAYRQEVVTSGGKTETRVSSLGATYSVSAPGESWRSGVADLAAKGLAKKETRAAGVMATAKARPMRAFPGAAAGMAGAPMAPTTLSSFVGAAGGRGEAIYGDEGSMSAFADSSGSVSRRDSNLDDILLKAAKKKAAEALNVEYEHK